MTEQRLPPRGDDISVDAETWERELLPELLGEDAQMLGELDRDMIFDALMEFGKSHPDIIRVEARMSDGGISADAPLLVPRARLHLQAKGVIHDAVKRMVRLAVIYAAAGSANPTIAYVGLTVDLVLEIFSKTSRLDPLDAEIVRALIELRKSSEETLPTEADVRRAVPEVEDLESRLKSLEARGVVEGDASGWRVAF